MGPLPTGGGGKEYPHQIEDTLEAFGVAHPPYYLP